jgi:hypothetical protein
LRWRICSSGPRNPRKRDGLKAVPYEGLHTPLSVIRDNGYTAVRRGRPSGRPVVIQAVLTVIQVVLTVIQVVLTVIQAVLTVIQVVLSSFRPS